MKLIQLLKIGTAAIMMFMLIFAVQSFTKNHKAGVQTYFYISPGTGSGDFKNAANWDTSNSDNVSCGSGSERPCKIEVPDNVSLQDFLDTKTDQEIYDMSDGHKAGL